MESAALIISGIATAAAVLAMLASRRSARAAARIVELDEERRHDERAPRFTARYGQTRWAASQPEDDVVWFDYRAGPGALASANVRLITRADAEQPVLLNIAACDGEWAQQVELVDPFDLEIGTETLIRVDRDRDRNGGEAVFVVECAAGNEVWAVPVRCAIPSDAPFTDR